MTELEDISLHVTFQNFCDTCEKIKSAKGHEKYDILNNFLEECKTSNKSSNAANLYHVLRLLLPQAERERGPYGIKETTFAKLYIRVLNLPKQGHDALKLLNYKAPLSASTIDADFAEMAYWIVKVRCCSNNKSLSIADINKYLDNIASCHGGDGSRTIDDELTKLINDLSPLQQKWLIRIILKDLKLGIGQMKILSLFHVDAPDLFDSSISLQKVCTTLFNQNIHLNEIEVEIFSSFRPMLSERLDIAKINNFTKKGDVYFMETKFDGERFQIHMKNNVFKYFSRNGYEYTENFGATFTNGNYTKELKEALNSSVKSFIIDGEMMGWHKALKRFSSKGINFDVKKITERSSYQPCFCAFDILFCDDVILTNKPLFERLKYLDELFENREGVIIHSSRMQVTDSEKILETLNHAIDNQEEGIVIKNILSPYKPNSRKGGWYKIKPEYTEGIMNELDFLIVGGYYAENKQHGFIGSVLLGVASYDKKVFYSCGRVKLTVSKDELEELCGKLQPHWHIVNKETNPTSVCWTKDKPDMWIEPHNSCIVQVKATELVYSTQFKTEYTLRFPRVVKIRYDKPWYDCITLEEFTNLTEYSHGVEKLTARNINENDIESGSKTNKKGSFIKLGNQFQPLMISKLEERSTLFQGKEFCVITGNEEITKSELEIKILENSGQVVQNPGNNTFCILAGNMNNVRVANAIKSGKYNIATIDWFLRALKPEYISVGKILEWTPRDLIGSSMETAESFVFKYDEYGDSYTVAATHDSLLYSLEKIKKSVFPIYLLHSEILELDYMLFNGPNPYSFLRTCKFYFLTNCLTELQDIQLQILKCNILLYAGECCDIINSETTHVIVMTCDKTSIYNAIKCIQNNKYNTFIVNTEWILKCLEEKKIISTAEYVIDKEDDFLNK